MLRRRVDPPTGHPLPREGWLVRDARTAARCGQVLHEQLDRVAVPELTTLLDRDHLLAFISAGAHGWWLVPKPAFAVAFLLVDQGSSAQLDAALGTLDSEPHDPRTAEVTAWLRLRSTAGTAR